MQASVHTPAPAYSEYEPWCLIKQMKNLHEWTKMHVMQTSKIINNIFYFDQLVDYLFNYVLLLEYLMSKIITFDGLYIYLFIQI
jgi:hypothetical protein